MKYNIIQHIKDVPKKNLQGLITGAAIGSAAAMYKNHQNDEDIFQKNVLLGGLLGAGAGAGTQYLLKRKNNLTAMDIGTPQIYDRRRDEEIRKRIRRMERARLKRAWKRLLGRES